MATPKTTAIASKPAIQYIHGHPVGMPDPEHPWPWKSDQERTRTAALPYWQARFKKYPELYRHWILPADPVVRPKQA